jgi:cytochrome c oxidase subunit II
VKRAARRQAIACILFLAGCENTPAALDPGAPEASAIADLFWLFTAIAVAIWTAVVIALALALVRKRRREADPMDLEPSAERTYGRVVGAAIGLTAATLLLLTGLSYATQKVIFSAPDPGISLRIVGHQWWWEVTYEDPLASESFTTANEVHLPAGEAVRIRLGSEDVIHSFWVPNLAGKMDLIPGRETELRIAPDRPGVFRGQCAEFCGWQHAHMGLLVVIEPRADFEAWRAAQLPPAAQPEDVHRRRGQQVFLASACVMCHTIRGTPAGGRTGPDLTHVASRQHLAAGTLPMTRGALAAWIVDPQTIKPGVHMPIVPLEPAEIDPLVAYLEGLK